jgi:hypothetical protein
VAESRESSPAGRQGRCSTHPGVARVGECDVCGRSLCIACATPVRGRLVGTECLPTVVQDISPITAVAPPISRRGDVLAGAGFLAVLVISVFPWGRGAVSGLFGAWTGNWSLLAVAAALSGLAAAAVEWRRGWRPGLSASLYATLGLVAGIAAVLHRIDPPLLSEPATASGLAVVAAGIAVAGGAVKARDVLEARRAVY